MSKKHSALWQYLEAAGVLDKTDAEIKAAKRAYRKEYFSAHKKKQRSNKPEFTVGFSKQKGEYQKIIQAAGKHKLAPTAFIRAAALAYLNQTFIVPNQELVFHLEQLLGECLNEIKTIVHTNERFFWQREQQLEVIEKRIEKLEAQINNLFRNPPLALAQHDHQNQVA